MEQVDIRRTRSFMVISDEMKTTHRILGLLGSLGFGMHRHDYDGIWDVLGEKARHVLHGSYPTVLV